MIPKQDIERVDESLNTRTYWRHFDASTYLRNELYMEFVKSKDKQDMLKKVWAINMSQKWGCNADALYKKCPNRCPIFDTPLDYGLGKNTIVRNVSGESNDWFRPSVDHVVARSNGGSVNDVANMVIISLSANTLKSNLETLEELDTLYNGLKRVYFT
jgi:hypothetical protein